MSQAPELHRLAHTLGVDSARLAALAVVPDGDLRSLRRQIEAALFDADRVHFVKVAALARAMPVAVAAKLTEHALPPLLAARTAELLDPNRAVELVARLSDPYLAEVSAAIDPARVAELIARIPAERVALIGAELARRREWVVIGGFVAQVSPAALSATVGRFDGEQLLRVGYVLEEKARLDEIAGLLSDAQIEDMLVAASRLHLWSELDDLLLHVSTPRVSRLADRFAAAPAAVQQAVRSAAELGDLRGPRVEALTGGS